MSLMSNYIPKGKSPNSTLTKGNVTLIRTPPLLRVNTTWPDAPIKPPRDSHHDVEQDAQDAVPNDDFEVSTSGLDLERTFSAVPGSGQVGGFIMGPRVGRMLNLDTPPKKRFKTISSSIVSPLTERLKIIERKRSPTPVLGESGEQYTRPRSPTLAKLNEAISPRTDIAVKGLKSLSQEHAVLNACDSDGNVNTVALDQSTINAGVQQAAKEQRLKELITCGEDMYRFRFSNQETKEFLETLDDLKDIIQSRSNIWEQASFYYEEPVTLDHEGKSISEMTRLLGASELMGLDLVDLCSRPEFTVMCVVQTFTGRMYHMTWNAAPSVKLIVTEATAKLMFLREDDEGAVEVPTVNAQLYGNESEEESEDEEPEGEKETTGLNRSFSPEPLVMPKVGDIYMRKARDGPQYAWVEHNGSRTLRNEFMKQGHRVEVVSLFPDDTWPALNFCSLDGGIVSIDMHISGPNFNPYFVRVEDFYKHMELVSEEGLSKEKPSVEQKSGGSMSEQQSRSLLASKDAFKRAQLNAKDSSNKSSKDKKRKAVDNKRSTPTKQSKHIHSC